MKFFNTTREQKNCMMKNSCKIGAVLLLASLMQNEIAAQSRPQQSLYLMNYNLLNPAATGVENFGQIQAGLRRQWAGIDGAPSTNWITGNFALKHRRNIETATDGEYSRPTGVDNGHGLGFTFYQENIGPYSIVNLNAAYAYHVKLSEEAAISLGFSGGMQHTRYDVSKNIYPDQSIDPAVGNQSANLNKWSPDLNAGLLFYTRDFFIGSSLMQIIPSRYINTPGSNSRYKPQWLNSAGYSFDLDDGGTRMWLSGVVKTDFANPLRYDINAKVSFRNICWLGGSYRRKDAFGGQLGINITPAFVCAYLYDYSLLNQMGIYSRGSHEVTVGYRFLKQHQNISPRLGW